MVKQVLLLFLCGIIFALAGCGDNGSADISYINMPAPAPTPTETFWPSQKSNVSMNVLDMEQLAFEGAVVVLTNTVNNNEMRAAVDADGNVSFANVPYGDYTLTMPGYTNDQPPMITVDAPTSSFNYNFERANVDFRLTVSKGETPFTVLEFAYLTNYRGAEISLAYDGSAQAFIAKDVPVGRYFLAAGNDNNEDGPYDVYTAQLDVTIQNHVVTASLTQYTSKVQYFLPVPHKALRSIQLSNSNPSIIICENEVKLYRVIFYTNITDSGFLTLINEGFKDFPRNDKIESGLNNFYPLVTPVGRDDTVTIVDLLIIDASALSINGMSINGMSINGMSINGMSTNGMSINGMSTNGMSINGMSTIGMSTVDIPINEGCISVALGGRDCDALWYVFDKDDMTTGIFMARFYISPQESQLLEVSIEGYEDVNTDISNLQMLPLPSVEGKYFHILLLMTPQE